MKRIFGYLSALFVTLIFTFYLDGKTGVIMLAFMIVTPLISLVIAVITKNSVFINVKSESVINKNKTVSIVIEITKNNIVPTAFIDVKTYYSLNFNKITNEDRYRISMFTEKKTQILYILEAKISGNAETGISNAYIKDFLGIFKFRIKNILNENVNITIIPEIHDIKKTAQFLKCISDTVISDNEEEVDNTVISANTSSGYEHREYVKGDSIKKINWKLSAKKGSLMVRLDEVNSSAGLTFVMDFMEVKRSVDKLHDLINKEHLIEGMLSMLNLFVKQGIKCDLIYVRENKVKVKSLKNIYDVNTVAIDIATVRFHDNNDNDSILLANELSVRSGIFIIYSMTADDILNKNLLSINYKKCVVHRVYLQTEVVLGENIWNITEEYDVRKIT